MAPTSEPQDRSEFVKELLGLGWHTEDGMYVHPSDREINLWCNPFTGELLFSPKLVEHLRTLAPVIQVIAEGKAR